MDCITFTTTDIREIELIRPLWVQLNGHHHARARYFRSSYESMTFDERRAYFEKIAGTGRLRIELAADPSTGRHVGYCVGSISPEGYGEIESIFVEAPYRSAGVGTALMQRILSWMDGSGAARKRVVVADGNEEAWEFYRRFGFHPRATILEQKTGE